MRKFSFFLLPLLFLCASTAWGWDGVDPLNYYYLKNTTHSTYVYAFSSKNNNQWFGLTSISNATQFTVNQYNASNSTWPTAYSFYDSNDNAVRWLGESKGNTEKWSGYGEWWTVNESNGSFQLHHSSDVERRLNATGATSYVNVPKANGGDTWIYWVVEPKNSNNTITEYYLYNVGQGVFLTNTDNRPAISTNNDQAVKITINKSHYSSIKFYGINQYFYQSKGTSEASNSPLDFYIYNANGGFYLYSRNGGEGVLGNTIHNRYLHASSNSGYCAFDKEENCNANNRTWKFITEAEYEGAKPKYEFSATVNASIIDLSGSEDPTTGGGTVTVSFTAEDGATIDDNTQNTPSASTSATATLVTRKLFATTSMSATPTYTASASSGYAFLGWSTSEDIEDIVSTANPYTPVTGVSVSNSTMNTKVSNSATTLYALFSDQLVPSIVIADEEDASLLVGETISFEFGNTSATYPSTSNQVNFWYEIVNNTPDGETITTGSANPDKIIMFTADGDGNTLTACNAGTAKIIFHQEAVDNTAPDFDIIDKNFEFTITVSKKTPSAFSQLVTTKPINSIITQAEFIAETGSDGAVTLSIDDDYSAYAEIVDGKIYTYKTQAAVPISVSQAETYMWSAPSNETFNLEITGLVWTWAPEAPVSGNNYYIRARGTNLYINSNNTVGSINTVWKMTNTSGREWAIVEANNSAHFLEVMCINQSGGWDNNNFRIYSDGQDNWGEGEAKFTRTTPAVDGSATDGYRIFAKDINSGSFQTWNVGVSYNEDKYLTPEGRTFEGGITQMWDFISEDQYRAYYYYNQACDAIQNLVDEYPDNEDADALKVAMVEVLAENDYSSENSYSERVTNLMEVISNCNSFVAAESGSYTLTVSSVGWATLCLPFAADIPLGITAIYYANAVDLDAEPKLIKLTPIVSGSIAEEEAIIINAAPGEYTFTQTAASPSKIAANILGGTTESTPFDANEVYVLAGVNASVPYFAPLLAETGAPKAVLPANKAYLAASYLSSGGTVPSRISLVVEDTNTATSVESLDGAEQAHKVIRNNQILILRGNEIYDVMGRKLQ